MARYRLYKWQFGFDSFPTLQAFVPQPRSRKHVESVAVEANLVNDLYRRGAWTIELEWGGLDEAQWRTLVTTLTLNTYESRRCSFYLPDRAYNWIFCNGIISVASYNRDYFYRDNRLLVTVVEKVNA